MSYGELLVFDNQEPHVCSLIHWEHWLNYGWITYFSVCSVFKSHKTTRFHHVSWRYWTSNMPQVHDIESAWINHNQTMGEIHWNPYFLWPRTWFSPRLMVKKQRSPVETPQGPRNRHARDMLKGSAIGSSEQGTAWLSLQMPWGHGKGAEDVGKTGLAGGLVWRTVSVSLSLSMAYYRY